MKAIIYAGIGLFSAATVYGLADYYNSREKGIFKKLYVEEKTPAMTPVRQAKTAEVIIVKNEEISPVETKPVSVKVKSPKKIKRVEKTLRFENFSRARIPEPLVIEDSVIEKKIKQQ